MEQIWWHLRLLGRIHLKINIWYIRTFLCAHDNNLCPQEIITSRRTLWNNFLVFSQEYQVEIVIYWFHVQIFWYCPSKPCPHTHIASPCTWISSVSAQTTCLYSYRDIAACMDFLSSRFNSCPHHWVAPVCMWHLCVQLCSLIQNFLCNNPVKIPRPNGRPGLVWTNEIIPAILWVCLLDFF